MGIDSNQAYCPSPGGIATVDSGYPDFIMQMTIPVGNSNWGFIMRYVDINNFIWFQRITAFSDSRLVARVGGSDSGFALLNSWTPGDGDVIRFEVSGSNYDMYANGVQKIFGATCGSFLTAVNHGLLAGDTTARFEDFSIVSI